MSKDDFQLQPTEPGTLAVPTNALTILEKAVSGGITQENVAVVKELVQMAREQRAEEAKAAFARAFFQLRKEMPELYADKAGRDKNGNETFRYASEEEISRMIEPHLMRHGFAMLFGQSSNDGRITVNVTLIHESGHSETRDFTVRAGQPNAMKDGAMCDAGGATTAWRHLMMKMFGLKSRIVAEADAAVEGERISADKVQYLVEQVRETGSDAKKFLALAGVERFEDIRAGSYDVLVRALAAKARK